MNQSTVNSPAHTLLKYTVRIQSTLCMVLILGIFNISYGQGSLREIIEENRRQIDDLTRQLWDSKKKIAVLTERNNKRSSTDAIVAEELYMLQQGVYDLGNRLKKLKEIVSPPTTRSDVSPKDIQLYLDRFEQKIQEIEESLQRINRTSSIIRSEIPSYNLEQENMELIQHSFRVYYSSFPSPSSQLIRLDRAYAQDVRQIHLEFNVRDKNNAYSISIRNASGYMVPDFRSEPVSLRGKVAWKRKSCRLGPGRYTVLISYRGKSLSTYSFTLL